MTGMILTNIKENLLLTHTQDKHYEPILPSTFKVLFSKEQEEKLPQRETKLLRVSSSGYPGKIPR